MPFMATDGEADASGWEAEPGRPGAWLQLEFPNPTKTTGATIYWDSKNPEENVYHLEYSRDGKNWKQVPGAGCSREKTTVRGLGMLRDSIRFRPVRARRYRICIEAGNDSTGTPDGEKVRISCWFITHSHSDHMAGASGFLRRYHDKVDLERVMFNFPAFAVRPAETAYASQFRHTLRTYYPDVTFLKPHTGMHLDLASMGIDVMYTHEDAVSAENPAKYPLRDYNCTSTVLRIVMGGCTAILFGDTNVEAERIITRNYSPASWKADMVQISHHCFNYLTTLYGWCQAPLIVVPNSMENTHTEKNLPKLQDALQYATAGAYYEGDDTYGFSPSESGFVLCFQKPRIGRHHLSIAARIWSA